MIERNLLIEAGAGTGKTTRLVKAVLQALFIRQIPLESIVALTFTNKAAGELKERVGSALDDVLVAGKIDQLKTRPWWPSPEPSLPLSDLQKLAEDARAVLDRANISTIHSFAFALLKRFPLAAGIDPKAEIDDKGLRFDELFRREWPLWLAVELSEKPPREALWTELLSKVTLSQVQEAVRRFADFEVPLEHLRTPDNDMRPRLTELHKEIRELIAAHGGNQKADDVARACEEMIGKAAHPSSPAATGGGPMDPRPTTAGDDVHATKAWPEGDIARLKISQKIALNLLAGGDHVIGLLTEALAPFVEHFRQVLLREGCLTHSALLYLSREIVKNRPEIRAALKRSIRLILIDEFQDTDPLQAELLLYLAEMDGRHAPHWESVRLEPGKLFIVGDPKQSIYRFRGADIAAYERIGKLVISQGGLQETLEVNYRSQSQVIDLVNRAFEKIITAEPEISPPYIAVKPHHVRDPKEAVQDVDVWLADSADEQSTEEAQATEAEAAARWIKDAFGTLTVYDPSLPDGPKRRLMLYKDVALIFRTYGPMDRFIEALRRHGIPFAVESERYFFTTPEVTDFVNLLRAAADPEDLLSLVGYLRGPMGGLTDEEILTRRHADTLEDVDTVKWLRGITARLGRQPLAEVLQYVFDHTWLMEMAARSYHGDQTVANLLKLRRLLEAFAAEGLTTMGLLLKKLEEFFNDDKIEGESPLADENYNAVRLLTIHKAKGLEYPVVFLPSLHSELKAHKADTFIYDWRSQKMGLTIGNFSNLEKLLLDEQTRRREAAEENRILYVGMTRARERLVLSGGVHLKSNKKKTYLQRLLGAWELVLEDLGTARVTLGDTSISVRRLERFTAASGAAPEKTATPWANVDPADFAGIWKSRAARCQKAEETTLVMTPTSITVGAAPRGRPQSASIKPEPRLMSMDFDSPDSDFAPSDSYFGRPRGAAPTLLGTLIHRFLEQWDFTCEKCSMPAKLRQVANAFFASEGLLREPFPDPKDSDPKTPLPQAGEDGRRPGEGGSIDIVALVTEAQHLLADFIGSVAWEEIKGSTILGREIPFFYAINEPAGAAPRGRPQSESKTMMRGTIDILYRLPSGKVVIGDYKSGQTKHDYEAQGQAYKEAVKRALGENAAFKIISLRS